MPIAHRLLLLAVSLASAPALRAQAPAGPVTPPPGQKIQQAPPGAEVRVRVALVNTPATVTDKKGNLINDLTAGDFRVTDNGVEQKISHFDFGGDPLSVVVLLETSSRIDPLLPEIRKTGTLFTQAVIGEGGEAAVIGFNDAVDKLQDFTKDSDVIERTVSNLQTGTSGSRLYDAMSIAVEMLGKRPQPTAQTPGRRRILFVLSETVDSGSETKLGEVLRRAQLANVTIFSVGLSTTRAELRSKTPHSQPDRSTPPGINPLPAPPGTMQIPENDPTRYGDVDILAAAVWVVQRIGNQVKDHAMDIAAAATGGNHLSTFKDRSIENAVDQLGGELHSQYSISYTPTSGSTLGYHEIKVWVNRKNLNVRARPGYYIASPES
jgi:VWFA-related protein